MNDGRLHPDVLKQLPAIEDQELSDQHWELRHITGEAAKPGGNRYQITISGNRISGQWNFRSGELARLAREASAKSHVIS